MRDRNILRKTINEKRRRLADADIIVKNNCIAHVILQSELGGHSTFELDPGETVSVPFEDMRSIMVKQKSLFQSFMVVIEDLYCPGEEELSVEDVEEVLSIGSIKKGLMDTPDEYLFDELLLECSFEDFKNEVNNMKRAVIERLIERAVILFKDELFSDNYKMSLLEDKLGLKYVFEDSKRSEKEIKSDIDVMEE